MTNAQAILDELRALRREVAAVAADIELIREAVQRQGARLAQLERPRRTPLPAGVPQIDERW